jgi:hypothetical protein
MSRSVEVHPLAIAISVLTGTTLAGIPGALLAVPLVAFLNATIHALNRSLPAEAEAAAAEAEVPIADVPGVADSSTGMDGDEGRLDDPSE